MLSWDIKALLCVISRPQKQNYLCTDSCFKLNHFVNVGLIRVPTSCDLTPLTGLKIRGTAAPTNCFYATVPLSVFLCGFSIVARRNSTNSSCEMQSFSCFSVRHKDKPLLASFIYPLSSCGGFILPRWHLTGFLRVLQVLENTWI